jgi:hypothetical protein
MLKKKHTCLFPIHLLVFYHSLKPFLGYRIHRKDSPLVNLSCAPNTPIGAEELLNRQSSLSMAQSLVLDFIQIDRSAPESGSTPELNPNIESEE